MRITLGLQWWCVVVFCQKLIKAIGIFGISLVCFLGLVPQADALPLDFQDEGVLSGLNQPVFLVTLPDNRMLVLQKGGEIRIFDPLVTPATSTIYMTITNIESGGERGLTSLVLDPDFSSNGYFYVYYTHASSVRNRISRFTHQGNTASLASEVLIWEDNEDWSDDFHYGGGMDFGPDGRLYLATGEEFDPPQAQDLTRAGGKIIRINKDGSIPADNPFVDGPGGNLDEIWAYGLRNPFRAHWDIIGNRFYVGEVGGNVQETAMEDLHLGEAGANYGWPDCEGDCVNPAYSDPVYTYPHTFGGTQGSFVLGGAITAGFIYRGNMFPSEYYEAFFLADYVHGWIRYLKFDAAGNVASATDLSTTVNNVVALVQGPEGALYYVDIYGEVRRITYTSGNQPPQITSADATPVSGVAPLSVTFSATATDPESDPLTYHWLFGDGVEADGISVSHVYNNNGVYTAYVQVSDSINTTLSFPIEIQVGNPPQASILTPEFGLPFRALDIINFSGTATDPDETLTESNYSWTIRFLHNAHTHPVLDGYVGSTGSFQINDSGHDYFDFTGFELILTLTDSDGLTGTDRTEVYPDKVNLNFSTVPAGQKIFLDNLPLNTPIVYDSMIGFRHTISAPGTFCDAATDTGYQFSSWSDGGSQTHEITVPTVDLDLVASYVATGPCINLVTSGLVLRLESDQGLASNAGTVTSWADQSGMGNNLVASGAPLVQAGALNGHTAVDFDGVDDKLERTLTLNGLPAGNADRTVYLVANYRGTGFGGFAYGQGACNEAFGAVVDSVGDLTVQGWCPENDFATTEVGIGAGWLVQSVVLEAGTLRHYKDGVQIDTQSHVFNTTLSKIALGAEIADFQFLDMQVAAVLMYDRALTSAELQQVDGYLASKYFGVGTLTIETNSLPDGALGSGYNEALTASGGTSPYGWSVATGSLPEGLFLDPTTGVISGTPTIAQTTGFTLTVTDSVGASVTSGTLTITITDPSGGTPATVIITDPIEGATVGGPDVLVTYTLAGSGYDHMHLKVDSDPHITLTSLTGSYLLTGIASGVHSITAQLVTAEHAPLSNPESNDTINITVTIAGNQPPVAVNDASSVVTGSSVGIAVLSNDTDADGSIDPTTVTIVTAPANGTVLDDGAGLLTYTHDGSATTSDSFTYTVADTLGGVSNTATVALTVVTQPLVTTGLVLHLDADVGVTGAAGAVTGWQDQSGLGNDVVSSGDPMMVSGALNGHPVIDFDGVGDKLERTLTLNGLPAGNADRTVFMVGNYRGIGSGYGGFAYGNPSCDQAFGLVVDGTGKLTVQGYCNDFIAPDAGVGAGWLTQSAVLSGGVLTHYKGGAQIDTATHTFNTVLSKIVLSTEVANNDFIDMQIATVLVYNRALSAAERQQVDTYLRDKYFPGSGGNQPPVAVDDTGAVSTGGSVNIPVLSNDTDDGTIDPTTVVIVTAPVNGTLIDDGAGLLTYTHDGSATASDSFTYTMADTLGGVSNTATVTLTVTVGANQPPVAVNDASSVVTGDSVGISVLSNDTDADGSIDPTTVTIVTPPANGTVLDDGAGLLTYTHDGSATISDSFTYTVADTLGAVSNTATVTVTIGSQPLVTTGLVLHLDADVGVTNSAGMVTGWQDQSGLGNDVVSSGNPLMVSGALNGHPVIDFDGVGDKLERTLTLNGLPAGNADRTVFMVGNYRGIGSGYGGFSYGSASCSQAFGLIVDGTGKLTVQGYCNDFIAPDPGVGAGWLTQSAVLSGGVLTHYKGGTQIDTASYTFNTVLSKIVLSAELANNDFIDMQIATVLVYNRALSAAERQQVDTYLQDKYFPGSGGNQPPVAVDDAGTVSTGGSVNIPVLGNDSDPDGTIDPATVTIVTSPANGALVDDGAGLLTYTHDGSATTSDSFTYTVADTLGGVSNTATVTLTVTAVSVSPQDCIDQTPGVNPQDCVIQLFDGQTLGDTYPWFDSTGFSDPNQIFRVENGLLRVTGTDIGALITNQTYKNYHMILEFKWGSQTFGPRQGNAKDAGLLLHGHGLEGSASTNWMPHIQSQIMEGGMGDFILLKGTDQGGSPLPISITSTVEQVTCVFNTWNCRGGYRWKDTGTQQVFNQDIDSVHLLNWDPSWQDVEGFRGSFDVENADGEWNQMVAVANGDRIEIFVNGIKVNEATNVVPAEGKIQLEVEWAEYFVRRWELWPIAAAPVPQNPVTNQAPVAVNDSATVLASGSVDIAVLGNDTDDGTIDPTTVVIVTAPVNGTLIDDGAGLLTYTHNGSVTTGDSFTYNVTDDLGIVSNTATVTLTITGGTNQPPVAVNDASSVVTGDSVGISVLSNDTDADGTVDPATITIVTQPANGAVVDAGSGVLTYTHDGSATASDSFTYTVADDLGAVSNIATVTLTITGGTNQPPVAVDDSATVVTAGGSVGIAVLTNDTDADGTVDPATITIVTPPANGAVVDAGSGVLTYTHDGSATTSDSFTYTVADDLGVVSNSATVTITVNQAPIAMDDIAAVVPGGSAPVTVLSNDTDPDGSIDPSTITIFTPPANGTVVDAGSGILVYTHDGSATTSDSFTYTVADDLGAESNIATVTITVSASAPDGDLAPLGSPDGILNVADILIMTRIVMGEIPATGLELQHGDLYPPGAPDGVIDLSDLILQRPLVVQSGP